jgi:hypothetical protein
MRTLPFPAESTKGLAQKKCLDEIDVEPYVLAEQVRANASIVAKPVDAQYSRDGTV